MEKTSTVFSRIPASSGGGAFEVLEAYKRETEHTRRDRIRAENLKEVVITEITRKYDLYEKLFAAVFAERGAAVRQFVKVIDRGMKEKDNELVLAGMDTLSGLAASSPFAAAGELKELTGINRP